MIKYKGTSLYPNALYDILDNTVGILNYVIEVYTNEIGTDEICVKIGCIKPSPEMEKEIKDHFRATLRVAPIIQFLDMGEINKIQLPALSRKPLKFIDKRENLFL